MVHLYSEVGLYIWASTGERGSLSIHRQSLGDGLPKSEQVHTVAAAHVPLVVAALGGSPDDDVLDLIEARADSIVAPADGRWSGAPFDGNWLLGPAEARWLTLHGIHHDWWGSGRD